MITTRYFATAAFGVVLGFTALLPIAALSQHHGSSHSAAPQHAAAADGRQMVTMPDPMVAHMLTNMRDHLLAIEEIQAAVGNGQWDQAAKIAETRLGMSSLGTHGAEHMAGLMPKGMQEAGTQMHRAASKFALAAQDAAVTGDWKVAITSLAAITTNCNGCHAGYRVR